MNPSSDFIGHLKSILDKDDRYKEDAYLFVMTALGSLLKQMDKPRHVSGGELLKGIRIEAREQFGPMAEPVFDHWGIKNSLDFGQIVFNMVREGVLSKAENDSLEDFRDCFSFKNLFDESLEYKLSEEKSVVVTH